MNVLMNLPIHVLKKMPIVTFINLLIYIVMRIPIQILTDRVTSIQISADFREDIQLPAGETVTFHWLRG